MRPTLQQSDYNIFNRILFNRFKLITYSFSLQVPPVKTGRFLLHIKDWRSDSIIPKNWKYLRGDIYFADMEPHIGSEQGGMRPVIVLQNDVGNRYAPTLIVATVTSRTEKKKHQPTHVLIDHNTAFEKPSVVQLEQIFTIDKSRVQRFLGQTSRHEMRRIEEALLNSLEINEWDRRSADE